MSEPIGDLVHEILAARPHFVLLPQHLVDEYKRELVPESLPDYALDCITNIRVHRAGHTAIVASSVQTENGNDYGVGNGIAGLRVHPSNPVTGYTL